MKLVAAKSAAPENMNDIETFVVSKTQLQYLADVARDMNPDMPMAFAGAHVIRTLLERFEESGIDLTGASNEEELTRLAARALRQRDCERRQSRS
jgi:hypothetical protein